MAVLEDEMDNDTSHKLLNKTQIICARDYFITTKSDNPLQPPFPSTWSHTPPVLRPIFKPITSTSHISDTYFACITTD
jgi:hypothetical protein